MSKEELEKEAVKYGVNNCGDCYGCHKKYRRNKNCERLKSVVKTYLASAEPREKQIEIDAEQIRALQKQNGELTDENERLKGDLELWESGACRKTNLDKCGVVKELEAQIEKMKRYIKACWVEENLNDYSSYMTNTSDEFRGLVKELRNGR